MENSSLRTFCYGSVRVHWGCTSPDSLGFTPGMTRSDYLRETCLISMLLWRGEVTPGSAPEGKADGLGTVTNKSAQGLLASTHKPPTLQSRGLNDVSTRPSPTRSSQLGEGLAFRQRLWDP